MGKIFVNELFRNLYLNDREFVREERLHIIPDSLQPRHGYEGGSCSSIPAPPYSPLRYECLSCVSIPAHHTSTIGMHIGLASTYPRNRISPIGMNIRAVLTYLHSHFFLLGMKIEVVPTYLHSHFFLLGMNIWATSTYPHNRISIIVMNTSSFFVISPKTTKKRRPHRTALLFQIGYIKFRIVSIYSPVIPVRSTLSTK